jgi:hypothetical protein
MSISETSKDPTEKQNKSRKEYLATWRKNNPDKSKAYSRKANKKYYLKNSEKKKTKFKINYHKYNIRNAKPFEYVCSSCRELVFADHKCFNEHSFCPRNLWSIGHSLEIDIQQIRINKQFVINLQNQGVLPIFLLYDDQIYLNFNEYNKIDGAEFSKCYYLIKEDPTQESMYLDNYHKAVNEQYTQYLGSVK